MNLALQITAVTVATALRLAQPGWLVVMFVLSVVGPLLLLGQLVLGGVAMRRPQLPACVATPFVVATASLVTANLLIADAGDGPRLLSPLELVTGVLPAGVQGVGWFLLLVWVASVVWALAALSVTWPRLPVTHPQPGPVGPLVLR